MATDFVPDVIPPTITCDPADYFPQVERPDAKGYLLRFSCAPKGMKSVTCPSSHPNVAQKQGLTPVQGRPGWFQVEATCTRDKASSAGSNMAIYAVLGVGAIALVWFATRG
jgi:hypothetical protein